jgi:hypothetical protein
MSTYSSTTHRGISLHIGVNHVDPAHYGGWKGALASPENDADTLRDIALLRGFAASQLKTAQATRAAVAQAIGDAANRLQPGDLFLLTYAGHGGQLRDLDGDEEDRLDDTWILYDGHLLDDEFSLLFSQFSAGTRVLMLSDSCHSGTMLKSGAVDPVAGQRVVDDFDIPRLIPRQAALETARAQREFYAAIQRSIPRPRPPIAATVRLLSGCQEHEKSWGNKETGRFTAAVKKVWSGGAFQGDYDRFHHAVVEELKFAMNPQTPQHTVVGAPDPEFDRQNPFAI